METASLAELSAAIAAGIAPIVFRETSHLDYWKVHSDHVAVVVGLDTAAVLLNDPHFDSAPQQTSLPSFQAARAANEHFAAFIRPRA